MEGMFEVLCALDIQLTKKPRRPHVANALNVLGRANKTFYVSWVIRYCIAFGKKLLVEATLFVALEYEGIQSFLRRGRRRDGSSHGSLTHVG